MYGAKMSFSEAQQKEISKAMKGTYASHVLKRLLVLKLRALDQYDNKKQGRWRGCMKPQ